MKKTRVVSVYNEQNKLIFRGSLRQAAKFMRVTRAHIYDVINGVSKGLSADSPAHYFVVDEQIYHKYIKPDNVYDVGYEFNVKGYPMLITNIEKTDNGYKYTFNGVITSNPRTKFTDYAHLWINAERALKRYKK